ncbi:MAG: TRAP transporter small permease [Spirochaetes bacterium]|nr:TRAP transporter small permease [Spirochaetota bacterium]
MRKIYRALCKAETALCGAGFIALVLLILLSAGLRFFRFSMAWNIDLALFLLAWTAFLGADIAWRDNKLFGIDIVTRRLPGLAQHLVRIAVLATILVGLSIIVIYGSQLAWFERTRRFQSIPVPYSFALLSLLVAAASMAFSTLLKIFHCAVAIKDNLKELGLLGAKPAGKKEAAT